MKNVSFIGAGNLAWHLAPALDNTDYAVKEVYSRNLKKASAIADKLYQATTKSTLDFSDSPSRIFFLAISDDAIPEIIPQLILPSESLLVHTSGSVPLSALGFAPTPNTGVFYPLQTFTVGRKIDFNDIPIFIESENPETEKALVKMAKALTKKVHKISSEERKTLHIAAVFASNFTNHLLTVSQQLLKEHKLSFDLLKPLIAETMNKSLTLGPDKSQTGPAKRGDLELLDKHFEYLSNDTALAEIYRAISQHIVDTYNEE